MSPVNRAKVEAAKKAGGRMVGTIYKRTRADGPNGEKMQRAEIRFDDVAGCLRTPAGGSSRQTIMVIEGKRVRSRLLSPREAARLMGLPDSYLLPKSTINRPMQTRRQKLRPLLIDLPRPSLRPLSRRPGRAATPAATAAARKARR
ncbi:DNA methyltransferase [Escherichia coli]|nr:DNA methyltransferase [Salmonella enterica]EDY7090918.1 DNA methyltransferase [Salmonella enterica subsp. enterica serovar Litchfield]EEQ1736799.1 DNA methyltransferase [Escherichia coli]EFA6547011.1 DNA methyltransferase [Escherichia coli O157:H7]EHE8152586.1 DNA methyltransferase [Salmonella enterica subsp. enterica serovar Agona]EKK43737.1 cytosine-specific methyltransferase [Escherichia coli 8.0566]EKK44518.1 C-5 cytosine-specific DNA methylase family protein [Escherichia coli 8.0569]